MPSKADKNVPHPVGNNVPSVWDRLDAEDPTKPPKVPMKTSLSANFEGTIAEFNQWVDTTFKTPEVLRIQVSLSESNRSSDMLRKLPDEVDGGPAVPGGTHGPVFRSKIPVIRNLAGHGPTPNNLHRDVLSILIHSRDGDTGRGSSNGRQRSTPPGLVFKISGIKEVRERWHVGLKEAKDFWETHIPELFEEFVELGHLRREGP